MLSPVVSVQFPQTSYVNDLCSLAANLAVNNAYLDRHLAPPDYSSLPPLSTATGSYGVSYMPPSPPLSPPATSIMCNADAPVQYPSTSYVNDLCSLAANNAVTNAYPESQLAPPDFSYPPPASTAYTCDYRVAYITASPPLSPLPTAKPDSKCSKSQPVSIPPPLLSSQYINMSTKVKTDLQFNNFVKNFINQLPSKDIDCNNSSQEEQQPVSIPPPQELRQKLLQLISDLTSKAIVKSQTTL